MSDLLVLIVDDHPVVVSGCETILSRDPSIKVISAEDEKSGFRAYSAKRPDIAIVDINLPDLSGFELLRRILKVDADASVIMLSMNDDPTFALRAIELGAKGFVSKGDDPRLLLKAVRQVAKGEKFIAPELARSVAFSRTAARSDPKSQLTPRELESLRLLARGNRIGDMAKTLGVSYKTVANTTAVLKQKLGAGSHSELIRIAIDAGLD